MHGMLHKFQMFENLQTFARDQSKMKGNKSYYFRVTGRHRTCIARFKRLQILINCYLLHVTAFVITVSLKAIDVLVFWPTRKFYCLERQSSDGKGNSVYCTDASLRTEKQLQIIGGIITKQPYGWRFEMVTFCSVQRICNEYISIRCEWRFFTIWNGICLEPRDLIKMTFLPEMEVLKANKEYIIL